MISVKFSVIVPVFNAEQYLDACVQSVLNQEYQNFELILINDGSKDQSALICDKYARLSHKVRVVHKENEGQLATRIKGLQQATGDYVVYLDADDELEWTALGVIYNAIVHYKVDCVMYQWVRVAEGVCQEGKIPIKYCGHPMASKELLKIILMDNQYNPMWQRCIKRSCFAELDYSSFYHIRHGEDLLQSLETVLQCKNAVIIPDILYRYKINPQSVTQSIGFTNYRPDYTIREKVLEFIEREHIFNAVELTEYQNYCRKLIANELFVIGKMDTHAKNKKLLFDMIKETQYYKSFINTGDYLPACLGKSRVLFDAFRAGHYVTLLLIIKCYIFLQRLNIIKGRIR